MSRDCAPPSTESPQPVSAKAPEMAMPRIGRRQASLSASGTFAEGIAPEAVPPSTGEVTHR